MTATQKPPRVIAAADLSPISPSPVHTSPPAVVPDLQDRADALDVASLDSLTSPAVLQAANPTIVTSMASSIPIDSAGDPDTIVVAGDSSDDLQDESIVDDDDSFDAYGEDHDAKQGEGVGGQQTAPGNDDYAQTFDSPPLSDQVQSQPQPQPQPSGANANASPPKRFAAAITGRTKSNEPEPSPGSSIAPQSEASGTAEPLNSPSAPDPTNESRPPPIGPVPTLTSVQGTAFSPSAPAPVSVPAPAPAFAASNPDLVSSSSPVQDISLSGNPAPSRPVSAQNQVEPSTEPDSSSTGVISSPGSSPADGSSLGLSTATAAEESTSTSATIAPPTASAGDETPPIDIQKLVDDITARAVDTPSLAAPQQSHSPPASSHLSEPPQTASSSLNVSQPPSSSLPPKPLPIEESGQSSLRPQDFHPFQSQPPNAHSALSDTHMTGGLPSATEDDPFLSFPAPSTSFHNSPPSVAPIPRAPPAVGVPPKENIHQANDNGASRAHQDWDTFQVDEKHYLADAKWDRFPDGSRIFIGEPSNASLQP